MRQAPRSTFRNASETLKWTDVALTVFALVVSKLILVVWCDASIQANINGLFHNVMAITSLLFMLLARRKFEAWKAAKNRKSSSRAKSAPDLLVYFVEGEDDRQRMMH